MLRNFGLFVYTFPLPVGIKSCGENAVDTYTRERLEPVINKTDMKHSHENNGQGNFKYKRPSGFFLGAYG